MNDCEALLKNVSRLQSIQDVLWKRDAEGLMFSIFVRVMAKSIRKRNFENGVVTDDSSLIEPLEDQFDAVWRGDFCKDCRRREFCVDPIIS